MRNGRKTALLLFLFILPGVLSSQIAVDPYEWNLGEVLRNKVYTGSVTIKNNGEETVSVSLMSTCSCLTLSESEWDLKPGEVRSVDLFYDTVDDTREFEKLLIIRTSDPSLPKAFFPVFGQVTGASPEAEEIFPAKPSLEGRENEAAAFDYYYDPGCRVCQEFLEDYVPRLAVKVGEEIYINRRELNRPENYEELDLVLHSRGIEWRAVPVLVSSAAVLQGDKEIQTGLESLVAGTYTPSIQEKPVGKMKEGFVGLLLAIILAGLLDGVNPCAFTTLIFLISALTVAGHSRKDILFIGLFFSLSVYLTYFLVGAGFFALLRAAGSFSLIARVIRWILVLVLILFGVLSLVDYFQIKRGRPESIILQLPGSVKKRIHGTIRTRMHSAALIGSSLVVGVMISLFELGCTGQIYFPTLTYMIQREGGMTGWILLGIYNLAFIIPLLTVFFALFFGYGSKKLTLLFKRKMGVIKLLTAGLFFGLAVLTFFT